MNPRMLRNSLNAILIPCLCLALAACDSGSDEPETSNSASLVGSYTLAGFTDKTGSLSGNSGTIITAGEPYVTTVDFQGQSISLSLEISGSLSLTAQNRYTFALTTKASFNNQPPETDSDTDAGSWTATSSQLTITSDSNEEEPVQVLTYSLTQSTLTLEDAETKLVFQKN